jgi:putative glutamine amidotransferase
MGPGAPVIGITAAIESARWAVWEDIEANLSPRSYSHAVGAAGAIPVILAADDRTTADADPLLDLLDGLILSGGGDLDPAIYGAEPDPQTTGVRAERDRFELVLAHGALERDLPLLGICRGMELLNVACGGTLERQVAEAELHLHAPGQFADHDVRLEPGSLAARAVGAERVAVRSHHHQGVARLGDGLVASGWAEPGGLVEAIEIPRRSFVLGILWHAEEHRPSPVVAAMAEATRARVAA